MLSLSPRYALLPVVGTALTWEASGLLERAAERPSAYHDPIDRSKVPETPDATGLVPGV